METTMHTATQNAQIIRWLKRGRTLTAWQAVHKFHCINLSGRISELRHAGHMILSLPTKQNGKRFVKYTLAVD